MRLHTAFIRYYRSYCLGLFLVLGSVLGQAVYAQTSYPSDATTAYLRWEEDFPTALRSAKTFIKSDDESLRQWGYIIEGAVALQQGRYQQAVARFDSLETLDLDGLQRYALLTEKLAMYEYLGHTEAFFDTYIAWQQSTRRFITTTTTERIPLAEHLHAKGLYTLYRYYVEVGNIPLAIAQLNTLQHYSPEVAGFANKDYELSKLYTQGKGHAQRLAHLDAGLKCLAYATEKGDANTQIALLLDIASWLYDNGERDLTGYRQAQLQLLLTPPGQTTITTPENKSWQYTTLQRAFALIEAQHHQRLRIDAHLARAKYHTQCYAFDSAMHDLQAGIQLLPQLPMRSAERNLYEYASIVAIALGDKPLSDKYRNAYLDLLNLTRLDKSQEATLREQQHTLDAISHTTLIAIIAAVIFVALCLLISWLWLRSKQQHERILQQLLTDCERAAQGLSPLYAERINNGRHRDLASAYQQIFSHLEQTQAHDDTDQQQREDLLEAQALAEHQLEQNKRVNVELRAKILLGTAPIVYIDRLLHLLTHQPTATDLDYGQQLVQRILTINQHLTTWVQMKRGKIGIKIETFAVQDVLNIVAKATPALQAQGITLDIQAPEGMSIKADKALTLFMLNTLVDNARKHTPKGGTITISVQPTEGNTPMAEIAVADTGSGIAPEKLQQLLHGKITYNQQKQQGFGLLNCRGIMNHYHKVSSLFAQSTFTADSTVGKGTRFAFTLPRGAVVCLIVLFTLFMPRVASAQSQPIPEPHIITIAEGKQAADSAFDNDFQPDSQHRMLRPSPLWNKAQRFADSVYISNVRLDFKATLRYADSAIHYINAYVAQQPQYAQLPTTGKQMLRHDTTDNVLQASEILWYQANLRADYSLFLDIRNELAVAYLGLGLLTPYRYNNEVYLQLYRTVTHKAYTQERINDTIIKTRAFHFILMALIVVVLIIVGYIYVRQLHRHVIHHGYMRQRLKTSLSLLNTTPLTQRLQRLQPHLADFTPLQDLGITVLNDKGQPLYTYTTSSRLNTYDIQQAQLRATEAGTLYQEEKIAIWPITAPDTPQQVVGYITLLLHERHLQPHIVAHLSHTLQFITHLIYTTVISEQQVKDNIEILQDQLALKQHDSQQLYVQNALIENILSVLKHETMYFPTRLAQLLSTDSATPPSAEHFELLHSIAQHYRELCEVLLLQATQQFALQAYQWQYVRTSLLYQHLKAITQQHNRTHHTSITLVPKGQVERRIYVEPLLIEVAIRQIWQAIHPHLPSDAQLLCEQSITSDDRFALCTLTLPISLKQAYPIVESLDADYFSAEAGITPLLLCKTIIRMHDQRTFHAGYRITISEHQGHSTITTAWLLHHTANTTHL